MGSSKGGCGCMCHRFHGILVVLFGVTFLLGNLEVLNQHWVSLIWPSIIVIGGLKSLAAGMCKCCSNS